MDAIPTETHAAEIAATVDDLERGLTVLPLSTGINRIDDWRRTILATERTDLHPIADALGELHTALTGEGRDGAVIARLLTTLGERTEASAEGADEAVRGGLQRLGSLLRHVGSALS